jgi:hypothetical protein
MSDREFVLILSAWFLAVVLLWFPFVDIFSRWSPWLRKVLAERARAVESRRQDVVKARLGSVSVTSLPSQN